MGAVVDTLILGPSELLIIRIKYNKCVIEKLTKSCHNIQRYRVIIPDEDESNYYDFLIEEHIAMCSSKFYSRLESDKIFKERVKTKIENAIKSDENDFR